MIWRNAGHQPPLQRLDVTPAFVEHGAAAPGQRPHQHPACTGCGVFRIAPIALEIADDDPDGLRGQQRHPGKIGAGQARIRPKHGQHHKLWRGDADVGQPTFHGQPGRGLRLPQQIGEVALFAALARPGGGGRTPASAGGWRIFSPRGWIFSRNRIFAVLAFFGRPAISRRRRLAHDIRALIINQSTYNIRR